MKSIDIDFSLEEEQSKRHAYRIHLHGIKVYLDQSPEGYDLEDLSATGCSFHMKNVSCSENDTLFLKLMVREKVILAGIEARVVRIVDKNIVACSFTHLSERQEYALDKFILEIQKRIIALARI